MAEGIRGSGEVNNQQGLNVAALNYFIIVDISHAPVGQRPCLIRVSQCEMCTLCAHGLKRIPDSSVLALASGDHWLCGLIERA